MNNRELIETCRKLLERDDEPDQGEWIDTVESLCNALEKTDQELLALKKATEWLRKV